MSNRTRVVAISGSLRAESINTRILKAIQETSSDLVDVKIVDIANIPLFNADVLEAEVPAPVRELSEQIVNADAVLIATPEYNYSVPGVLKNVIDWVSKVPERPLSRKPVAIIGGSPGMLGTVRAQVHLRDVLLALNADVVTKPEVYIVRAHNVVQNDGFTREDTSKFVRSLIEALNDLVQSKRSAVAA